MASRAARTACGSCAWYRAATTVARPLTAGAGVTFAAVTALAVLVKVSLAGLVAAEAAAGAVSYW